MIEDLLREAVETRKATMALGEIIGRLCAKMDRILVQVRLLQKATKNESWLPEGAGEAIDELCRLTGVSQE